MRELALLLILIFFSATLPGNAMFMFSIEQGEVHAESFSLNHILKAACPAMDTEPGFGTSRNLSHRHILLSNSVVQEDTAVPVPAQIETGKNSPPASSALGNSSAKKSSDLFLGSRSRLKLPISSLHQSTVLLI
ncbi:MAG: hypothetical protein R3297_05545 [Desulfobulbales bacterium]|nr:hypothetical protein [Desulfobulbales bacterium]